MQQHIKQEEEAGGFALPSDSNDGEEKVDFDLTKKFIKEI